MIIDENLLLENGAVYKDYADKEIIFHFGSIPQYYFQIVTGTVEVNTYHEDGKEFTFNILLAGQSVGTSLLLGKHQYPMNSAAKGNSRLLILPKDKFLKLICENHQIMLNILRHLSDRLFYKYVMLFNNSNSDPSTKIRSLLDYYKESSVSKEQYSYVVPLTRQQIANLTGLRVETVIRSIKKMEREHILKLMGRKILY